MNRYKSKMATLAGAAALVALSTAPLQGWSAGESDYSSLDERLNDRLSATASSQLDRLKLPTALSGKADVSTILDPSLRTATGRHQVSVRR